MTQREPEEDRRAADQSEHQPDRPAERRRDCPGDATARAGDHHSADERDGLDTAAAR